MSVFEYNTFETIDFLLRRDWFVDTADIMELLWTADQETYDRVVANRKIYSERIRHMLEPINSIPGKKRRQFVLKVVPELSLTREQ